MGKVQNNMMLNHGIFYNYQHILGTLQKCLFGRVDITFKGRSPWYKASILLQIKCIFHT